jgi:hypothetical protein
MLILIIRTVAAKQELFDWTPYHKHNGDQQRDNYRYTPCSEAAQYARDSRDPRRGSGRQSMHLVPTLALNDHASTDEADPGDDALDDPTGCAS